MYKPNLSELTAFSAIARHRNFRAAADELGVSPSALSHTLRNLEQRMGLRLLNRTTRSVAPTEAGEWLAGRLTPLLQEFDKTFEDIGTWGGRTAGTLKISLGLLAGRLLLQRTVPEFLDAYPDVQLDLVVEVRLIDIVAENFDAGIRLAESVPQDMIAVPFGSDLRCVVVASPDYLKGRSVPKAPDDLRAHNCIRSRYPSGKPYRWEFEKDGQELTIEVQGSLTLNQVDLMIEAARNGLGIANVLESEAAAYIETGELEILLPDWCPSYPGFCLYYPGHRHVPAPLRAFINFLKKNRV